MSVVASLPSRRARSSSQRCGAQGSVGRPRRSELLSSTPRTTTETEASAIAAAAGGAVLVCSWCGDAVEEEEGGVVVRVLRIQSNLLTALHSRLLARGHAPRPPTGDSPLTCGLLSTMVQFTCAQLSTGLSREEFSAVLVLAMELRARDHSKDHKRYEQAVCRRLCQASAPGLQPFLTSK